MLPIFFYLFPQGQGMTMWLEMGPTKIDGDNADEDIFKDYDDDAQNYNCR